ncbi:B3/B4 domain-containing protein [Turicibacter sanguinis]|mgnify:CR=1 FL=1|uniref:B3/B4 domain-containing protein n=1 Tax=Turicibacter sanguinis TaxID=154288 RepID=UPI00241F61E7|nr:phenylalanine--tRNA ligase beta subunit-related protein [Turicibacter sanguinis]
MTTIKIDQQLKEKVPGYCLAVLSFEMTVKPTDDALKNEMLEMEKDVMNRLTLETLLKEPRIVAARSGYKALGKDPSRYRLSTEALLRRLIKGSGLYFVNNAVDIGNVLSVKTQRSVAVLDLDKIQGDVLIRIGQDEAYEGIGRGQINIENIPVYCDEIGPFGTPTSDTPRTRITEETKKILLFITSFNGTDGLEEDAKLAQDLFTKYGEMMNLSMYLVE